MREIKVNRIIIMSVFLLAVCAVCGYASNLPSSVHQASQTVIITQAADKSLDALIFKAENNNPLIKAAHERVLRAESAIKEAESKMGPKASLAVGALWQQNDPLLPAINPATGEILAVVPLGFRNTYAAAVGFVQTIYSGGSITAGRRASMLAKDAAFAEEIRALQSVKHAVSAAYYNRKRAEEKQIVAEESVALAKEHLDKAEKLFKAGVVANGDVLRSKVAVADAELNLIRAVNAVELTLSAIERAVGMPVATMELNGEMSNPRLNLSDLLQPSEAQVDTACENRQELKIYRLLSRQADQIARASQGQLLPQIVAGGAWSSVGSEFFPSGNEEWRLGLAAYWTVFDSGEIAAKTRQAKAQARELLYLLDDMKNLIKMEVKQAEVSLRSAESRLVVTERQVSESEEDYRIAVRRYENHVGTNLDILDSRLALMNSKTERIDAIYDIYIAYADLLYAVGK